MLLVDGLDEATHLTQAQIALDRIVAFAQAFDVEVICTSRPRGFSSLGAPGTWATANLAALNDKQICEFSARWFALTDGELTDEINFADAKLRAQGRSETFLAALRINSRTHQLARVPLLCQTLIELFRTSHRLPQDRQAVYSEIITLLLSRHPDARARAAGTPITPDTLNVGHRDIREILYRIAWTMQFGERVVVENSIKLEKVCAEYLADEVDGLGLRKVDSERLAQAIISALVSWFGILVENAPQELGFVHLSIQEFLAAEAISRKSEKVQESWIESVWLNAEVFANFN